jgi:prepilin signal peptidase PulO-like enzyme (type II secretory pathway)
METNGMWLLESLMVIWFAYLGGSIGSFSNVVASRWPLGESIVSPGSRCPRCFAPIRWHDNIPILGWFLLRGRCRKCQLPISVRYLLVEIVFALVFVALYFIDLRGRDAADRFEFMIHPQLANLLPFVSHAFLMSSLLTLSLICSSSLAVPRKFLVVVAGGILLLRLLRPDVAAGIRDLFWGGLLSCAACWVVSLLLGIRVEEKESRSVREGLIGLIFVGMGLGYGTVAPVAGISLLVGWVLVSARRWEWVAWGVALGTMVSIASVLIWPKG